MRSSLARLLAGAALVLSPAVGIAQSDDDGPIATAPEVHQQLPQPPESASDNTPPQAYAPRPAAYVPPPAPPPPPPQQQTYAAPPPAAYAPQPAYAAPQPQTPEPPAPPPEAAPAPAPAPAAQAFAPQQSPGAAAAGGGIAWATPGRHPSFLADTASKDAMAGALSFAGAAIAINQEMKAGDKLVADNAIEDPAIAIAQQIAQDYATLHGETVTAGSWDSAASGARYFVKVSTSGWGFTYYALDWNHYHLTYEAKLEVVDVASNRVVTKASCSHKADPAAERFTYDAMTQNGGELMKTQLKSIADECVAQFRTAVQKA